MPVNPNTALYTFLLGVIICIVLLFIGLYLLEDLNQDIFVSNVDELIDEVDMHVPTYHDKYLHACVHDYIGPLLFDDWRIVNGGHGVSLLAHSIWTVFGMDTLNTASKSDVLYRYVAHISPKMRRIGVLAALLHDVGKGGVGGRKGRKHKLHPSAGEDILLNNLEYIYVDNDDMKQIMVGAYLTEHCPLVFNVLTLRMLALITGMHYEMAHPKPVQYIRAFNYHLRKTELQDLSSDIRLQLLRICIALSAADVLGGRPVQSTKSQSWLMNELKEKDLVPNKDFWEPRSGPWTRYRYGDASNHKHAIPNRMDVIVNAYKRALLLGKNDGPISLDRLSKHIHTSELKHQKKQRKQKKKELL